MSTQLADNLRKSLKQRDERLFQAIFVVSFPVFLAIVIAARMVPGDSKKDTSVFSEASKSARSTIAMALMD
jgi:hypothetical protein